MRREKLILSRYAHSLKQKDVAKYLGVSIARYCKIETGTGNPTLKQIQMLIKLLKINISYF